MKQAEYRCEECGQRMETPAKTTTFRYSSKVITLYFCRDCTTEGYYT